MQQTPYYLQCVSEELSRRIEKRQGYSLRAFARALRMSPATLSRILSGQKIPSYELSQRFFQALGLAPESQTRFLESVTKARQASGYQRFSPELKKFKDHSYEQPKELSIDVFRMMSDWYYAAILELTFVDGFKPEFKWIAQQLGITVAEARIAIRRLLELELLRFENGTYVKADVHLVTADRALTTAAHRRRQRQILDRAIDSLENDPIEHRSNTGMTMAIDPAKLPAAKKKIDDFTNELCGFLEAGKRQQVYEMSISLFPLQKGKRP